MNIFNLTKISFDSGNGNYHFFKALQKQPNILQIILFNEAFKKFNQLYWNKKIEEVEL